MNKLPDEIILHIIDYSSICKKEQNFYINKHLANKIIEYKKCKPIMCLGKNICKDCHKDAVKFLRCLQYSIF